MINNYLKVAWRNLVRNKAHTFINMAGLSVGLACSMLILIWVQSELDVDAYHLNNKLLYKVYEREYTDHKIEGDYDTPAIMADELKKVMPEVQYAINMQEVNERHTFKTGDKILKVGGAYAGADIFKMFSYPLLKGSAQTALNSPLSIALSDKMARLFFGNAEQAIGKTIRFDNKKDFTIMAIFKDLPENSSRKFEYLINWQAYLSAYPGANRWDNSGPLTYIMLRADANPVLVEKKLTHFMGHYNPSGIGFRIENGLQKYDEVYLHSHFVNGKIEGGRIEYVNLFTLVAIFVLLIACVNFMNLTTAQSVNRAREIGVRKVMGAKRSVLIKQFMGESALLTAFAVLISLFLMTAFLSFFNQLTQKQLTIPFTESSFWLKLGSISIVTSFVSGLYPAFFLSSFNPIAVLKGKLSFSAGAVWFRKVLVVFQFTISAALIVATIIVSKQINFIQKANLGYDRKNLVYIPLEGELAKKFKIFKTEALNRPGILSISNISATPTFINDGTTSVTWDGKNAANTVSFNIASVGYDFVPTMKLKMLEGSDFSIDHPSDKDNYIINEPAAEKFGYTSPIGKSINMWGVKGKIIGVVQDFHFASLHEKIQPLILRMNADNPGEGEVLVRTKPGKTKEAIESLKSIYKEMNPGFPFTCSFSDEEYQKLYQLEQVAGKLANIFAFLAVFISSLGLLGLAMFTAEQRVKEIGIRKVLGASISSLFALLSSEFLVLVVVALLIASPVSYFAMNKWLQTFAYYAPVAWWVFVLSGGLIVVIALATVSFQAIKAALINPIKSLRSE